MQTAEMENELVNLQCQKGGEMSFQKKNANLLALQGRTYKDLIFIYLNGPELYKVQTSQMCIPTLNRCLILQITFIIPTWNKSPCTVTRNTELQ